ncbi:MAG: hypothetical protein AAGJ82_14145 [Bacteroidota bacterium]
MATITIYTNSNSDLQVVAGDWQSSSPLLTDLRQALSSYSYTLRMLGSKAETDAFNEDRRQRILYLETEGDTEKILAILRGFEDLVEAAHVKVPGSDPDGM